MKEGLTGHLIIRNGDYYDYNWRALPDIGRAIQA